MLPAEANVRNVEKQENVQDALRQRNFWLHSTSLDAPENELPCGKKARVTDVFILDARRFGTARMAAA
jgi:hypothetical protein